MDGKGVPLSNPVKQVQTPSVGRVLRKSYTTTFAPEKMRRKKGDVSIFLGKPIFRGVLLSVIQQQKVFFKHFWRGFPSPKPP